jgi:hypothetical protein
MELKMKACIFLLTFFLLAVSCEKNSLNPEIESDCMLAKIEAYKANDLPCESGKSVYRYEFQGNYVYVFNPGNCGADMMSEVYDEDCNLICGLGGIAGNTECNNEEFSTNAANEVLIWEN